MMRTLFRLSTCFVLATILLLMTTQFTFAYEREIDRLSMSMAEKISAAGKKTIAVVDFTDLQGNVTALGRFLAEEFSTALVNAGKGFQVVDRIHLKSILKEHKLSASGLIDPSTARQLGKIAGVDAIVTGTITPFGEKVRLSAKVLETDSAKVISASRGNIPKTEAIEELLAEGINQPEKNASSRGIHFKNSRAKQTPTIQKVEAYNFTFELLKFKRSGNNVACTLLITNNDQDRILKMKDGHGSGPFPKIYDNLGNVYEGGSAKLGNVKGNDPELLLIRNVSTKASLDFEGVSSNSTEAALLECWFIEPKKFSIEFRNIPFSK